MPENGAVHPRRTPLAVLALLVVLLLIAGGCSGSGDDGGSSEEGGDRASTTAVADGPGTADATGGSATETTLAPATGTPQPPEGGDLTAPARREDIPDVGRYTYETVVNGNDGEEFLDIIDAGGGDGYLRQLHIRGTDSDATSQAVVWLGNLFYAEAEQRARGGAMTKVCTWDPGLTLLKLPLTVGTTWVAESTCADAPGDPVRTRRLEVEVTGTDTVDVGGTPTDVVVIKLKNVTSADDDNPPLHVTETRTSTDLVSTKRHLLVRSEGTLDSALAGVPRGHDTFTKTLVSLDPAT